MHIRTVKAASLGVLLLGAALMSACGSSSPSSTVSPVSTAAARTASTPETCAGLGSALEAARARTSGSAALARQALATGCAAYVATSSTPSVLDLELIRGPLRGRAFAIGRVVTKTGNVSLTDIALTSSGTLYGVDFTSNLYVIDQANGAARLVGPIGFGVNGLVVGPTGTVYGASGYGLVTINPATGVGTEVGLMGFPSSGDLAFGADGTLYMTASASMTGPAPTDLLVGVNTTTAAGTLIGPTGQLHVYGLVVNQGTMFATTDRGDLLSIDPATGAGTVLATGGPSSNGMASSPTLVASNSTGSSPSATSPSPSTDPVPSTASSQLADGSYVLSTSSTGCGLDAGDLNGKVLTISGSQASVTSSNGAQFAGAVTRTGTGFRADTVLKGSTFSIVFTGAVTAPDAISGSYLYGGIPGGAAGGGQGVACTYPFTGARNSSAATAPAGTQASSSVLPCSAGTITSSVKAKTSNFYSMDGFGCSGRFAYAFVAVTNAQGSPVAQVTILLMAQGGAWTPVSRSYCQSGSVPAAIYQPACQTN